MAPMHSYPDPQRAKFAQFGFAIGTVRGYRAWRVVDDDDDSGRLRGIHHQQIWKPGENVAECRRATYNIKTYGSLRWPPLEILRDADGEPIWSEDGNAFPGEGHLRGCQCGFYAYFEGSNDYHAPVWHTDGYHGPVGGMVEGYGQTLIGSRGFRCSKARIVALLFVPDIPAGVRDAIEELYRMPVFESFDRMVKEIGCDDGGAKAAAAAAETERAAAEAERWMQEAARRAQRDLMGDA